MDFNSITYGFNRAVQYTFNLKKIVTVFFVLALCGLLVVFFRGLAWNAGQWVQLSLTFLPIFLCGGILLSLGIFLIRVYHNDVKKLGTSYRKIVIDSWEVIIGASYFAIPMILTYLFLWVMLGVFVLLRDLPIFGHFFSAVLSFAPFLINFTALLLCLFSLLMLFFVAPIIALQGMDRTLVFKNAFKRLEKDPFSNLVLVVIALFPLLIILTLLIISVLLTEAICLDCNNLPHIILKWFFIMLPFTALLTPAIIFFFNFAAEAHVLQKTKSK